PAPAARAPTVYPYRQRLERRTALPVTAARLTAEERSKLTARAAMASIAMAVALIGLKLWASIETGSMAMLGSLADSGLDLVASLVVLAGVRGAGLPRA